MATPNAADPVDNWIRHIFDPGQSVNIRPPLRSTGLWLHLIASTSGARSLRVLLDGNYHGGAAIAYAPGNVDTSSQPNRGHVAAGLVLLRWEWKP